MQELLFSDFFFRAVVAGMILAAIAGPLGSFVIWRRLSYFGDTLAHAALLGIAIGLLMHSNPQPAIILSSLLLAWLLAWLEQRRDLGSDTLLGVLAHSALAMGVVILALTNTTGVNLEAYLFGSMLTMGAIDLWWIAGVGAVVAGLLVRFWNPLVAVTVHAELAAIEGLNVRRLNQLLIMLIALTIAVSIRIVGVLLITSLLIIPAAASRPLANSPEQMAVAAAVTGMIAIVTGLLMAFQLNTPVAPSIVVIASLIFAGSCLLPRS